MARDGDCSDDELDMLWSDAEKLETPESQAPPTRSSFFLLLLTAGLGGQVFHRHSGMQCIFAFVFSNGSAYLNGLGVSKAALSLIWMIGPISGLTLQPYFGICSDQCRSPWGKRRPYIVSGALASIISLMGLGFSKNIASLFGHIIPGGYIGVFFVITLNIAVQPIQGGMRALLVDVCPRTQLAAANAMAATVISSANVLAYATGFIDLTSFELLRALGGDSQFTILCIITSVFLASSVGISCLVGREKNLETERDSTKQKEESVIARLWYLGSSFGRLPSQVRQVCKVQFCSWLGWFPFMYYVSSYIGDTFKRNVLVDDDGVQESDTDVQVSSTRIGSFGMLLFAIVTLLAGLVLSVVHKDAPSRKPTSLLSQLRRKMGVRRIWIASQLLFGACMFATIFVTSVGGICLLVGVSGMSWAVALWAPYAVISAHLSMSNDDQEEEPMAKSYSDNEKHQAERVEKPRDETERRPGVVIGLYNSSIAGAQITAAVICTIVFSMMQGTSQDSVGWALRIGCLTSIVAALLTRQIQDGDNHSEEEVRGPHGAAAT